jgi:protease I
MNTRSILAFVDDLYEDLELWYPKIRLEEEGWRVVVAGPVAGHTYKGKHGYPCKADAALADQQAAEYDGLLIPGGFMPDKLRREAKVLQLVRDFHAAGKPIAFICHAGWIPISAGILRGRRVTGSLGIKDDLVNAGALWVDEALVVDGHLISSRTPVDLASFAAGFVAALKKT